MRISDRLIAIGWDVKKTRPDLFLCISPIGQTCLMWYRGEWTAVRHETKELISVTEEYVTLRVDKLEAAYENTPK